MKIFKTYRIIGTRCYELLKCTNRQCLLNDKYTLSQIWRYILQRVKTRLPFEIYENYFLGYNRNRYKFYDKQKVVLTLSVIPSRKHCLFPNPSAAKQTLSPVPVHERHTISSYNFQNI